MSPPFPREFLASSLAGLLVLSPAAGQESGARSQPHLHVVCAGGHPDDPESGCGGHSRPERGAGSVREKKKRALFAHVSQDGEAIYRQHHEGMETFRGREAGCAAAEAFARLSQPLGPLPVER